MKNMMTKIFALTMAFVVWFGFMPMNTVEVQASAVPSYDADDALAYAKEHWDDTKQDCVVFLRGCFEAGGVEPDKDRQWDGKAYGYTVEDYVAYMVDNGYAELKEIKTETMDFTTGPEYWVNSKTNEGILSKGDGVLYKCNNKSCKKPYFHVSFCSGTEEAPEGEGDYMRYYQQNKMLENKALCKIKCTSCGAAKTKTTLYAIHIMSKDNGYSNYTKTVSNVKVTKNTDETLTVSWSKLSGASSYNVFVRKGLDQGAFEKVGNVKGTSFTYKPEEVRNYYFIVKPCKVIDGVTYVGNKSSIAYTTKIVTKPKVKVSNVSSSGKITLSWDKVSGATKYIVYRSSKSKTGPFTKMTTVTGLTFTNSSCTVGKPYYYKVVAVSPENQKTSSIVTGYAKLTKPTLAKSSKKLTWKKVTDAKKYYVYRATSKSGTYKKIATTSKLYYTDKTGTKGKTYYYKIKAVYDTSTTKYNSAYSNYVSIKQ